jgi:hypothetical protein
MTPAARELHRDDLACGQVHITMIKKEDPYENWELFLKSLQLLDGDFPLVISKANGWATPEKCGVCGGYVWEAPRLSPVEVKQIANKLHIRYVGSWRSAWGCKERRTPKSVVKETKDGNSNSRPTIIGECTVTARAGEPSGLSGVARELGATVVGSVEQSTPAECAGTDESDGRAEYENWWNCPGYSGVD